MEIREMPQRVGGEALSLIALARRCGSMTGAGRGEQGAGADELRAFDAVRAEHESMAAEAFNDDGTYKSCINLVRRTCCGGEPRPWPPPRARRRLTRSFVWAGLRRGLGGLGQVLDLKVGLATKQRLLLQLRCLMTPPST